MELEKRAPGAGTGRVRSLDSSVMTINEQKVSVVGVAGGSGTTPVVEQVSDDPGVVQRALCPECGMKVAFEGRMLVGEDLLCPGCHVAIEVAGVHPVVLERVPAVDGDDG